MFPRILLSFVAGWNAQQTPSGETFYVNHAEKSTSWTRPEVASAPVASAPPSIPSSTAGETTRFVVQNASFFFSVTRDFNTHVAFLQLHSSVCVCHHIKAVRSRVAFDFEAVAGLSRLDHVLSTEGVVLNERAQSR